jgi:hypothetical protein
VNFTINWQKPSIKTLHYGAFFQTKSNEIYFLSALWDSVEGILLIYGANKWDNVLPDQIAMSTIKGMRMRQVEVTKLIGGDSLFNESNDTAKQLNKAISRAGDSFKKITKPTMFDMYGSIVYVNSMFASDSVMVSDTLKEPASQFASWNYTEDGKKPISNFGYCEALCLIASELKLDVAKQSVKPKHPDYQDRKIDVEPVKASWQTS